jgi:hypothetical protein
VILVQEGIHAVSGLWKVVLVVCSLEDSEPASVRDEREKHLERTGPERKNERDIEITHLEGNPVSYSDIIFVSSGISVCIL